MTRADSPMYLSTMALDTTLRKLASMLEAMARASSVFPVPIGGGVHGQGRCWRQWLGPAVSSRCLSVGGGTVKADV